MKNKKSEMSGPGSMLAIVFGVFVFLILIGIIPNPLRQGVARASDFLSCASDFDDDGVLDCRDQCVCEPDKDELDVNRGCKRGVDIDYGPEDKKRFLDCPSSMQPDKSEEKP